MILTQKNNITINITSGNYIGKARLEHVINQTQRLTHQKIIKLQHNSREFYLQNKNNFADNLYQKVINL